MMEVNYAAELSKLEAVNSISLLFGTFGTGRDGQRALHRGDYGN